MLILPRLRCFWCLLILHKLHHHDERKKKIHSSEEQMSHQKNKMFKHKIKFLMPIADGSTSQSFIFNWTISFHCSRLIEKTVHRTRKQLRQNVKLFSSSLFQATETFFSYNTNSHFLKCLRWTVGSVSIFIRIQTGTLKYSFQRIKGRFESKSLNLNLPVLCSEKFEARMAGFPV